MWCLGKGRELAGDHKRRGRKRGNKKGRIKREEWAEGSGGMGEGKKKVGDRGRRIEKAMRGGRNK